MRRRAWWPRNSVRILPVDTSHRRQTMSSAIEATVLASGEATTRRIHLAWALSTVRSGVRVSVSQNMRRPS